MQSRHRHDQSGRKPAADWRQRGLLRVDSVIMIGSQLTLSTRAFNLLRRLQARLPQPSREAWVRLNASAAQKPNAIVAAAAGRNHIG